MASASASTHSLTHLTAWFFLFWGNHHSVPHWSLPSSANIYICSCVHPQCWDMEAARNIKPVNLRPWVRLKWWATSSQERCCFAWRTTALRSQQNWDIGRDLCKRYKENPSQPKLDSWHVCDCWKSYTIWNKKAFLRPVGRRRFLPT